jgi:hypothetical protein
VARTPSIRQQMTVIASQPREGRVMRTGVWRYGQQNIAALVGDLLPWIYPWLDHFEHWHRWSARRALLRYAIPLGRADTRGRPIIWLPRAEISKAVAKPLPKPPKR